MKRISEFFDCGLNGVGILTCVLSAVVLCGCRSEGGFRSMEGVIWHTGYHIIYDGDEALQDSVLATLHRVEESVSVFTPTSVVSRVNGNETDEVDSIFARVYGVSHRVYDESGGYFDPTLAPLIECYGFAGRVGEIPDSVARDSIMAFVGFNRTRLSFGRLYKDDERVRFNFSAIAKGYGCDAVGEMLRRNGCGDFLIEIGGEVVVSGRNPEGGKWRIQVDKPVYSAGDNTVHEAQEVIEITDCGVATSGNYRNYRETADGKRLGHTFDPHTGMPSQSDMASATVVAPTCMEADAYATACMAMTCAQAKEMAHRCRLKVLLVNADGEVWMSDGFKRLISK